MKKNISVSIAAIALMGMVSTAQADAGLYKRQGCAACHGTGAAGAPKVGDKAAWKARLKAAGGIDGLVKSAIKGKGQIMRPRGGKPNLTDAQIKSIVTFMVK